jgi:ERCC4-related helicase
MESLGSILAKFHLDHLQQKLMELGAGEALDLIDVDEEMQQELKLKPLEAKRFSKLQAKLQPQANVTASAPDETALGGPRPPSPLLASGEQPPTTAGPGSDLDCGAGSDGSGTTETDSSSDGFVVVSSPMEAPVSGCSLAKSVLILEYAGPLHDRLRSVPEEASLIKDLAAQFDAVVRHVVDCDVRKLLGALLNRDPCNVVTFLCHGAVLGGERGLSFGWEGSPDSTHPLDNRFIAKQLDEFARGHPELECVLLNACDTLSLGKLLRQSGAIKSVVCTTREVPDNAALAFSKGFWPMYLNHKPVSFAYLTGLGSATGLMSSTTRLLDHRSPSHVLLSDEAHDRDQLQSCAMLPAEKLTEFLKSRRSSHVGVSESKGELVSAVINFLRPLRDKRDEPRDYQRQGVELIKHENTIVHLETGLGKSLIAVLAIDHFYLRHSEKIILVVVPTRALVQQQAAYIRAQSTKPPLITEFSGTSFDQWTLEDWKRQLASPRGQCLVGTAEIFRKAAADIGALSADRISLVVIDECHKATGKDPSARLMQNLISQTIGDFAECGPRILGLTASFVNGKDNKMEKRKVQLERMLQAKFFTPEVKHTRVLSYENVEWLGGSPIDSASEGIVREEVRKLMSSAPRLVAPSDVDKFSRYASEVYRDLGGHAMQFYVRYGIIAQLRSAEVALAALGKSRRADRDLSEIEVHIENWAQQLGSLSTATTPTRKYYELENIVLHKQRGKKGIVFVRQISHTYPLAALLNNSLGAELVAVVSGGASMSEKLMHQNLANFRRGEIDILVATAALEEGIDVPDCQFVVQFDPVDVVKSHIQRSGRARFAQSTVYYFGNDQSDLRKRQAAMESVAADESIVATDEERTQWCKKLRTKSEFHPLFHGPDKRAQVDVLNARSLLHRYWQQSFEPDRVTKKYYYTIASVEVRTPPLLSHALCPTRKH